MLQEQVLRAKKSELQGFLTTFQEGISVAQKQIQQYVEAHQNASGRLAQIDELLASFFPGTPDEPTPVEGPNLSYVGKPCLPTHIEGVDDLQGTDKEEAAAEASPC